MQAVACVKILLVLGKNFRKHFVCSKNIYIKHTEATYFAHLAPPARATALLWTNIWGVCKIDILSSTHTHALHYYGATCACHTHPRTHALKPGTLQNASVAFWRRIPVKPHENATKKGSTKKKIVKISESVWEAEFSGVVMGAMLWHQMKINDSVEILLATMLYFLCYRLVCGLLRAVGMEIWQKPSKRRESVPLNVRRIFFSQHVNKLWHREEWE